MTKTKLPVLLLIFNRKKQALEALEPIRNYRPGVIYVAADGPRADKAGEEELCRETREAVCGAIDWDCRIVTRFRPDNMGCAYGVHDAISWFFGQEEHGIIVEDDVVLHPDFFMLCERLLPYYRDEDRVMMITAFNATPDLRKADRIGMTNSAYVWGWATWRRAWSHMDMDMKAWPAYPKPRLIREFGWFYGLMLFYYFRTTHRYPRRSSSWAVRWFFCMTVRRGLCLQSYVNLSRNIGLAGGTHYTDEDKHVYSHLSSGGLQLPLVLPDRVGPCRDKLRLDRKEFARMRMTNLKKKLRRLLHAGI